LPGGGRRWRGLLWSLSARRLLRRRLFTRRVRLGRDALRLGSAWGLLALRGWSLLARRRWRRSGLRTRRAGGRWRLSGALGHHRGARSAGRLLTGDRGALLLHLRVLGAVLVALVRDRHLLGGRRVPVSRIVPLVHGQRSGGTCTAPIPSIPSGSPG